MNLDGVLVGEDGKAVSEGYLSTLRVGIFMLKKISMTLPTYA